MATRTVGDRNEEGKREGSAALDEVRSALAKSMADQAKELATSLMESGSLAARVDGLLREKLLEAGRLGLERALEADRSDCGAANAPECGRCGGRTRHVFGERSPTETALGTVGVALGRYACLACGKSVRPRLARLDIEASMTPTARRMASELGSACCYAEADRLLNVVAGVNFGEKRVERTTRLVGDDLEAWPDALRRVPVARPADRFGARRGGLQDGGGTTHEMHRHALDGGRRQPRALGALRPAERLVRRPLGAPPSAGGVKRQRPLTKDLSHTLLMLNQPAQATSCGKVLGPHSHNAAIRAEAAMTESKLDWSKLLDPTRRKSLNGGSESISTGIGREEVERDYDRVLFAAPTRRLADKTQVFPQDRNDSVRTRLTHSHEVSNLGRSIGVRLAYDPHHRDAVFGGDADKLNVQRTVPALLAAVGLAHDLGNPPFGHQGEESMKQWCRCHTDQVDNAEDFRNFDGNCQTFRLLTRLLWQSVNCEGRFEAYVYSKISENYRRVYEKTEKTLHDKLHLVCDAVAGMTDRFLISIHNELKRLQG